MGVTLDLRLIDHERIVVGGLRAVNDSVRNGNHEILREYLKTLPVEVEPAIVTNRNRRLAHLRKLKAPDMIIQIEERSLALAKGEPYRPEKIEKATFDELRELLGTWCWLTHSYSLDKMWSELHWFLEPVAGRVYLTCPEYPGVGDPGQTVFAKAMIGSVPYPKDDLGDPIIRTCGSPREDCSGYNPPEVCKTILGALQRVNTAAWKERIPFRCELYKRDGRNVSDESIAERVGSELACAEEAFPILMSAYDTAVKKKYGVSCEYSL